MNADLSDDAREALNLYLAEVADDDDRKRKLK